MPNARNVIPDAPQGRAGTHPHGQLKMGPGSALRAVRDDKAVIQAAARAAIAASPAARALTAPPQTMSITAIFAG